MPAPASASSPYVNLYSREKPVLARVAGNMRITAEGTESDIHHVVLDFGASAFPFLEGQSIGIVPPGVDAKGRAQAQGELKKRHEDGTEGRDLAATGADSTAG